MKAIGYICITVFIAVYSSILNGWALSKLWLWFIVSTFDIRALSIPQAIGLSLVIAYLAHQHSSTEKKEEYWKQLLELFKLATFKPLFALAFGAIVKLWL